MQVPPNHPHAKLMERMQEWFPGEELPEVKVVHWDGEAVGLLGLDQGAIGRGIEVVQSLANRSHLPAFSVGKDRNTYFTTPVNAEARQIALNNAWLTEAEFQRLLRTMCRV